MRNPALGGLTAYQVYGLSLDFDEEVLRTVYKKKMSQHHPDKGGDRAEFEKYQVAYEILTTPGDRLTERRREEARLRAKFTPPAQPASPRYNAPPSSPFQTPSAPRPGAPFTTPPRASSPRPGSPPRSSPVPPGFEEGVRVVSRKLLLFAHYAVLLSWAFLLSLAVLVFSDAAFPASLVMFTVTGATLVISAPLTFPLVLRAVRIRIWLALGVYLPLFFLAALGHYYALVLSVIARVTFELVTRKRPS